MSGEKVELEVTPNVDVINKIASFAISTETDYLVLHIRYADGSFVNSPWGHVKRHPGSSKKEFDILLSIHALDVDHGEFTVKGHAMRFNPELTRFTAPGWELEYRPL